VTIATPLQTAPQFNEQALSIIERAHPKRLPVLLAVGRRLVPNLVEATLIPTILFYASFVMMGLTAALVATLTWSLVCVARRVVTKKPIPAIVLLAAFGISVRTFLAIASHSSFVYFFQPVLGKAVLACVFVVSVLMGRPLIARFASDFCSMSPDVAARPGIVRLYRRLTLLWAGVNMIAAAATLVLLRTLPVGLFVTIKPLIGWGITIPAIVLTVSLSVRAARNEELLVAISAGGTLSAHCGRAQVSQ
jgi:intracellular septation protein A